MVVRGKHDVLIHLVGEHEGVELLRQRRELSLLQPIEEMDLFQEGDAGRGIDRHKVILSNFTHDGTPIRGSFRQCG